MAQQESFLDDITKLVEELQIDKHDPEKLLRKLRFNVPIMRVLLQVLFTTAVYHMKTINRLYSTL